MTTSRFAAPGNAESLPVVSAYIPTGHSRGGLAHRRSANNKEAVNYIGVESGFIEWASFGSGRLEYIVSGDLDQDQTNRFEDSRMQFGDPKLVLDEYDVAAVAKVFKDISTKNTYREAWRKIETRNQKPIYNVDSGVPHLTVPLKEISTLFLFIFGGLTASSLFSDGKYIHPVAGAIIVLFLGSLIIMDFVYRRNLDKLEP